MSRKRSPALKARYERQDRRTKALRQTLREAGWINRPVWIDASLRERIHGRALQLGIFDRSVITAAVEVGLRYITASEIMRAETRWRELVGLPCAAKWEGAPFDLTKGFKWDEWNKRYGSLRKHKK